MLMLKSIPGKDKDQMTLIIEDREIVMESATLVKTMDTGADGFTCVIPWTPKLDSKLDLLTKPYSYNNSGIYIAGNLISEQILYDVTHNTGGRTEKTLEFWSKTADIIDSTVIAPYEMNNVKLTDRCKQQCNPFGINVIVGEDAASSLNETKKVIYSVKKRESYIYNIDLQKQTVSENYIYTPVKKSKLVTDEKKFSRIKAEPTDTIFSHLAKLAAQRGLLLSCTSNGDLLITKANINSKIVGTLEEGKTWLCDAYKAEWSGRSRFAIYRAMTKSASGKKAKGIQKATDKTIKSPRLLTFNSNDSLPGEVKNAAEWRRNKSAADAMTMQIPVNSWYAPDGTLWNPNTRITIISETLLCEKGFTFLITSVEYKYENGGTTANLSVKPPSLYSDGVIEEPWT